MDGDLAEAEQPPGRLLHLILQEEEGSGRLAPEARLDSLDPTLAPGLGVVARQGRHHRIQLVLRVLGQVELLGPFWFRLGDNQRAAVVLKKFEQDDDDPTLYVCRLSVLRFAEEYAGLKDKPYYDAIRQQLARADAG